MDQNTGTENSTSVFTTGIWSELGGSHEEHCSRNECLILKDNNMFLSSLFQKKKHKKVPFQSVYGASSSRKQAVRDWSESSAPFSARITFARSVDRKSRDLFAPSTIQRGTAD